MTNKKSISGYGFLLVLILFSLFFSTLSVEIVTDTTRPIIGEGVSILTPIPTGNITYQNVTYVNETIDVNETQFYKEPELTLKTSWLTSFLDDIYCRLTGCTITGDLNVDGDVDVGGNVSATYFVGDGSQLTGIQQGSLILFFLNESAEIYCPLCSGNKTLSTERVDEEVTLSGSGLPDGNTLLGAWITKPYVPNINYITEGNWLVHVEGTKTGGTKDVQFFYEVYITNLTGHNEELIATSGYSNALSDVRTKLDIWSYMEEKAINSTDRIRVKGYAYVSGGGSAPSVEAYIQGDSNTRLELPVGAVSVENFVPYTNAVKNVDLNSKNITTTGSGFFGWLGSLNNRITNIFTNEINAVNITSGNLTIYQNTTDIFFKTGGKNWCIGNCS